ncbi:GNAT family N-acetyltransferase [Ferruginibacter paludis]|uniref:GNAT family N-acetyltransferase n=1 Tax=Ferruginibacter paludis TaxID=1310417 RepID=UPI0025B4AA5F|nr:GNAT family N-acetyltransferase [Ferruginibacter paludis]MDN3656118.1 GNAT family N-acetyltransferase [Ferruginibacter paludis]
MEEDINVTNNKEQKRFEVDLEGEVAFIEYKFYKGDIAFMHSLVPESFRGKGVGTTLARAALEYANSEKLKVMLYCPFVSKFVKEHEEYQHLVDVNFNPSFKK